MEPFQDDDPFKIVKNYRKMIARRDRHHKKRKPKLYPPTNIKTRSMEQKQRNTPSQEIIEFEQYSEIIPNSSQWRQSESPGLLLLNQNQQEIENSIEIEALSLGSDQKPLDKNDGFLYWENEVNNDLNEQQLLSIN